MAKKAHLAEGMRNFAFKMLFTKNITMDRIQTGAAKFVSVTKASQEGKVGITSGRL